MAATLVAARGAGLAPAWGPEAITPDWENREVSTGVSKDAGFRICSPGLKWKDKTWLGWENWVERREVVCVMCLSRGRGILRMLE